jgi:hypothetical protein
MRALALILAFVVLSATSAFAQRPNCKDLYTHYSTPGQADNGTTVALPSGGFQTTYTDGWTHTSEPDSSYGAGGRQMVEKDDKGRVTLVTKCDPKNILRQMTQSEYQNSLIIMTITRWNAAGVQSGKEIQRMAAGTPPPPSPQGQPSQPTAPPQNDQSMGGPPPGDQGQGGPPPYDQGMGGPPPGSGTGIGVGGFGFGFGFGHKP